jgi:hypothetical protein
VFAHEADAERLRVKARALLLAELDKALARRAAADDVRAALGGTIIQFFEIRTTILFG